MTDRSLKDLFHFVVEAVPPEQQILTVPSETQVRDALQLMLEREFSQLPVMEGTEVLGTFSYRSLAKGLIQLPEKERDPLSLPVEEFTEDLKFASVRDELSSLLDEFDLMGAMLIGSPDRLQGIVTTSDALRYFHTVASPYVMLREIELAIRVLISICVSQKELIECVEQSLAKHYRTKGKEPPGRLEDMTFQDYVTLLKFRGTWERFRPGFGASADIANAKLALLPDLRNAVFHFRRELTAEEYERIHACRDWLLKRVRKAEATRKVSND